MSRRVPRFTVRLEVRTARPLSQAQLDEIHGERYELRVDGRPRASTLLAELVMDGGDVAGALARSMNVVLDQVPGEVRHAEVTQMQAGGAVRRRPRRRPGASI